MILQHILTPVLDAASQPHGVCACRPLRHKQPAAVWVRYRPSGVNSAESGAVVIMQERIAQEQRHARTCPNFLVAQFTC